LLLHGGVGEPFAAGRNGVALLGGVAAPQEEAVGRVAGVDLERGGAAAGGELFQRVDQQRGDAPIDGGRMDIQHADLVLALERGEADRRAGQSGDQGQFLAEIAAEVRGSPVYLTQVFQQVEGLPLYRYQLRLRLARALDLLARYDDLTALSLDLGFSSHSHFSAVFRQVYGRSPTEFKQLALHR